MRFKRSQKDTLTYYGFSYLFDATITTFADEDNILHRVGYCFSSLKSYGDKSNQDEGHLLDVKIKDIDQHCCRCLQEEPAVETIRVLAERFTFVYNFLHIPVPACNTSSEWKRACNLVADMKIVLRTESLAWHLQDKDWQQRHDDACDALREHSQKVEGMVIAKLDGSFREFGIATFLADSSPAALKLRAGNVDDDVEDISEGSFVPYDIDNVNAYAFVLQYWLNLVSEGVSAKDRHRKTMKMVGGTLIGDTREGSFPEDIPDTIAIIRSISRLVLQLETELAADIREEPKTFLVADKVNLFKDTAQITAQKFVLREENNMQLLAVPDDAIQVYINLWQPSLWALMPADENVLETAVKMWDSDPESVLCSPRNLVNVAETLLEK